jgi:hypothetical protein
MQRLSERRARKKRGVQQCEGRVGALYIHQDTERETETEIKTHTDGERQRHVHQKPHTHTEREGDAFIIATHTHKQKKETERERETKKTEGGRRLNDLAIGSFRPLSDGALVQQSLSQ